MVEYPERPNEQNIALHCGEKVLDIFGVHWTESLSLMDGSLLDH
jgi:hypothetical protein